MNKHQQQSHTDLLAKIDALPDSARRQILHKIMSVEVLRNFSAQSSKH